MAIAEAPRFVRADGPDKVTGSGRYVADMNLTGQLVAKFDREADPDLDAVRIGLSGNLCRCTGYAKILAAVEATAAELDG